MTVTGNANTQCAVTASQAGDTNWNPAPNVTLSVTIDPASATLTLSNPVVTYNAAPQAAQFNTSPAGLSFSVAYPATGTAPVFPGTYSVTATYHESELCGQCYSQFTIQKANTATTVISIQPNPMFIGQPAVVSFSVAPVAPGAGSPTGSVTVTASSGSGSCTAAVSAGSCSLSSSAAGAITLTATYSGDGNFIGSSGTAALVVSPPFNFTGFHGAADRSRNLSIAEQRRRRSIRDKPFRSSGS